MQNRMRTDGSREARVTSTAKETVCWAAAALTWIATRPPAHAILAYGTDNAALAFAINSARAPDPHTNELIALVHANAIESRLHFSAIWNSRETRLQQRADLLSRGLFDAFSDTCTHKPILERISKRTADRLPVLPV